MTATLVMLVAVVVYKEYLHTKDCDYCGCQSFDTPKIFILKC